MSEFVPFDGFEDGGVYDKNSIYNAECECGHKLYQHGFVQFGYSEGFYVSQCIMCDIKDGKFGCEQFKLKQ